MMNKTALISVSALGLMFSFGTFAQAQQTGADNAQTPAARAEQRAQRFSDLDSNGDGNISFEEFRAAPLAAFEQLDTDGDGNVSREEALERRFLQLDSDNNGLVTADEMSRPGRGAMTSQGQQRGQGNRQGNREGNRLGDGQRGQGERMRNMTPEQREQMRERMQQMTPEQREQMRQQMQTAPRR
jgi:Ca2+-binding EF-hand superfamily protein